MLREPKIALQCVTKQSAKLKGEWKTSKASIKEKSSRLAKGAWWRGGGKFRGIGSLEWVLRGEWLACCLTIYSR